MTERSKTHKRPLPLGTLSRLYSNGKSLFDVIVQVTRGTPVERETVDCLISPGDSLEYAELLLSRSFAVLSPESPPIKEHLRLEQQSSQEEASVFQLVRLCVFKAC